MTLHRCWLLAGALLVSACGSTADIQGGTAAGQQTAGGLGPTPTSVLGTPAPGGSGAGVPGTVSVGSGGAGGGGGAVVAPVAPGETIPPAPATAIPATGPGWDEEFVYV